MALLEIILLLVLIIPIFAIFTDSPLGRAVARRIAGEKEAHPEVADLLKRVDALESEVADLSIAVGALKEENQFFQRLLEEGAGRPPLPPPPSH